MGMRERMRMALRSARGAAPAVGREEQQNEGREGRYGRVDGGSERGIDRDSGACTRRRNKQEHWEGEMGWDGNI